MGSEPLWEVGSVPNCEGCFGRNLFRDNQGNGNLILVGLYSVLDVRVSADDGVTWTEPTALTNTANGINYSVMQDSSGNLHVVEAASTTDLQYHKISVTRTADDITSVSETNISLNGLLTNDLVMGSISIAELSDNESTPVKRVAISWVEESTSGAPGGQNVWAMMALTTNSAGLSPTVANDFANFAETAATAETVKTYTAGSTGGPSACTRMEWIQTGTDIGDIYLALRVYDGTNTSAREFNLFQAALNTPGGGAPYWGSFSSAATGSTPANSATGVGHFDMAWDSVNSEILMCLQDTTSTTSTNVDWWTVGTTGTVTKTGGPSDLTIGTSSTPDTMNFGWDSNDDLWFVCIDPSTICEVSQYKSSTWTSYDWTDVVIGPTTIVRHNTGNRVFLGLQTTVNTDYLVCSANIATLSETLKTSGGTYDAWADATSVGVPDIIPYDYTLTVSAKSGGWGNGAADWSLVIDDEKKHIASGVTAIVEALSTEAFNHSSATTPGKYDTGQVWIDAFYADLGVPTRSHTTGAGDLIFQDLQLECLRMQVFPDEAAITLRRCLILDTSGTFNLDLGCLGGGSVNLQNCALSTSSTVQSSAILTQTTAATAAGVTVDSCTIHTPSTNATGRGIQNSDASIALVVKNTLVETSTSTDDQSFVDSGGGWGASDYNIAGGPASSNAAPGGNSTSDQTSANLALVDPANDDYRIGSASTAIDAGSTTLTEDVLGTTRVATDDCGFYDYGANNPAGLEGPLVGPGALVGRGGMLIGPGRLVRGVFGFGRFLMKHILRRAG